MRIFEEPSLDAIQRIHRSFKAVSVRSGESVSARLVEGSDGRSHPVQVWRLSPVGIEVLVEDDFQADKGTHLGVSLVIGDQQLRRPAVVVDTQGKTPKGRLLGLTFTDTSQRKDTKTASPVRKITRWQTHHMLFPTGGAINPGRFSDKIFFRVLNVSKHGASIATSLRNKFIMPGLNLSGSIYFPNSGSVDFSAKIMSSSIREIDQKLYQILSLQFYVFSPESVRTIASYILNFGHTPGHLPSPKKLKKEGYGLLELGDAVEWDYVRTQQEYRKVLVLRSEAFKAVEGLGVVSSADEMADTFDARSRIVIARFRGEIIGTVRICFHGPDDAFEEEQYTTFPSNFPPRQLVVEASRAATHPDYRGADLFINMMRFTMLTVLQSGRRWLVQSTYGALVPIYKRIGFSEMGIKVPHPVFPGEQLTLLMADAQSVATARSGNPFLYQSLVPHIEAFLQSEAFSDLNWVERNRLYLYRRAAPLYKAYTKTNQLMRMVKKAFKRPTRS